MDEPDTPAQNPQSRKGPLTFRITFPFWTAWLATLQIIMRSPVQLAVSLVFPLAGAYLLYRFIAVHHIPGPGEIAMLLLCFLFMPLMTALTLYLGRRRNPFSRGPFTYVINSKGIHATAEAFDLSIKWTAITKTSESGSYFFFFTAPARALSFPKSQLDPTQLETLRNLAATHAVK